MSVFTTLTLADVQAHLADFAIGDIVEIKGIAAGITNTNYFVITTQARYVLTIFEKNDIEELPYFVQLMAHLATHHVPCPMPIQDRAGESLYLIKHKPALLVSCLEGKDIETPSIDQCAQVGRALAQLHLAGHGFPLESKNQRDAYWRKKTADCVAHRLTLTDQQLLQQALSFQESLALEALPQGVIHGDLFRDNVLFNGTQLGGFIDFYYACNDVLAYDVAIAVNDWCVLDTGVFDQAKYDALMQGYAAVRPFTKAEKKAWPGLLCIAALRFWLSRLYDWHYPQAGELTHAKDPDYFKRILQQRLVSAAA